MSDWDRYAAEEYELLVAEEGGTDGQEPLYVVFSFFNLFNLSYLKA